MSEYGYGQGRKMCNWASVEKTRGDGATQARVLRSESLTCAGPETGELIADCHI